MKSPFDRSSRYLIVLTLLSLTPLLTSCDSAIEQTIRGWKYNLYEMVGVEKHDLLEREVKETREEQKETAETFKSALDRMKELYNFEGGDLERQYKSLQASFDQASSQAEEVHRSVRQVETVANDLFKEWETESKEIKSPAVRAASRRKLSQTKKVYEDLHNNLVRSEAKMDPVLDRFRDQVLYLKHNLNAEAVASLKGEAARIENDIQKLITDMDRTIAAADRFSATIPRD